MNLKSFSKLAAVSIIALGTAMHSTGVIAAAFQIGDAITVPFGATVENSMNVVVTGGTFGTIGAMNDLTDVATMVLNPDDTFTEDPGTGFGGTDPASIVVDPVGVPAPAAANVAVTGAFENTDLYVTFQNCVNLTGGGNTFLLDNITTDLTTPGGYDCAAALGALTAGIGTTSGAGALTFNVGASILTNQAAAAAYTDGAYTGSVTMYIAY